MEDKFLVVVINDLNIVCKQRLCDTYKQARKVQREWRDTHHSGYDVEIQLLSESAQEEKDWAVIWLPEDWA
jgi:hypothetical protein